MKERGEAGFFQEGKGILLQKTGITRAAPLGVFLAAVAFSFALATSSGVSEQGGGAASRAVAAGTQVAFTNPLISDTIGTDRDLGVAVVGSAFSRYCRAAYGVAPYTFTHPASSTLVTGYGLKLDTTNGPTAGLVSGTLTSLVGTLIRFDVTVTDSATQASTSTAHFRITVANSGVFQFAVGTLDPAVQGRFYSVPLPAVINGNQSKLTYVVSAGDSAALAAAGLAVDTDGLTLSGVPSGTSPVAFTLYCQDANGNLARSFDGATVGQQYNLPVTAGAISSGLLVSALTMKAGMPAKSNGTATGSIKLTATTTLSVTNGQYLKVIIGSYASPVTDSAFANGKAKATAKAVAATFSKGKLTITVANQTIPDTYSTGAALVVVQITSDAAGKVVVAQVAENVPITATVQANKGDTVTLTKNIPPAGGVFQLTSVAGKDDNKSTVPATVWKVSFIAIPPSGSFTSTSGDVTIGNEDLPFTGGTTNNKGVLTYSFTKVNTGSTPKDNPDVLATLSMDPNKGKGALTTSDLSWNAGTNTGKTGTPAVTGTGLTTSGAFYMNVTLGSPATYQGEGLVQIAHTGTSWK